MNIIPAIDICNGKCIYTEFGINPIEVMQKWIDAGATVLHVVDMNGALHGPAKNISLVKQIIKESIIPVEVNIGKEHKALLEDQPPWQIILQASTKQELIAKNTITISISYNETDTDILRVKDLLDAATKLHIHRVIVRNVARDGSLSGVSLPALQTFREAFPNELVYSGGIASQKDISTLESLHYNACIVGKALYTKSISLT